MPDAPVSSTSLQVAPFTLTSNPNARMWVYVGDEAHPYNLFNFTLDRGRDGPKYFLKDYDQVLLADAYGGYNGVVAGNGITRAGCWAHWRRRVIEAEKAAPEIARRMLAGGVDILQLRAKGKLAPEIVSLAQQIEPLCRDFGAPLIINDHPWLVARCAAAGCHIAGSSVMEMRPLPT